MHVRGIIAFVVVALLAGSLPAAAQQTDPASGSMRARIKAKYLEKRDRFLHRAKDLYFAVGCKVLASEAGILPLTSHQSYLAYVGEQTLSKPRTKNFGKDPGQEVYEHPA